MANLNCNSKCGSEGDYNPPKTYEQLCAPRLRKNYGSKYFAKIAADVVFTDPTDKAEWQAFIDAGKICIGPCGKLEIGTPSSTVSTDTNNCGEEEIVLNTYTPTFETYNISEGLEHCEYFDNTAVNQCDYIIMFDCYGNVALSKEYRDFISGKTSVAPTGNPGFKYSLTQAPYASAGDENFEKWTFGVTIKLEGSQIICHTKIDGLLECLQDAIPTYVAPTV